MADQLKPCPFCGGRAEIKGGIHTKYVMCLSCEVMGPNLVSDAELIAAWNRRAPARADLVKALENSAAALRCALEVIPQNDPFRQKIAATEQAARTLAKAQDSA